MSTYKIGVSKTDITDNTKGLQMQGFADVRQKTASVLHHLFARAFVIEEDKDSQAKKVAIVTAEIWSCTKHVKLAVIDQLKQKLQTEEFSYENVHIAGTHTHSAPGGYAGYKLYNEPIKSNRKEEAKKADRTTKIIVDGIVKAILDANKKMKPGKIYMNKGTVDNCGKNRSLLAYLNNPKSELNKYTSDTDNEMQFLKFVHVNDTKEVPVGILSWYAIHPADLAQYNKRVSGDNKGEASRLFEKFAERSLNQKNFVAAFANANCGDVSGNVGFDMGHESSAKNYMKHMKLHGKLQFNEAKNLFLNASQEVSGSVDYWCTGVDMSKVKIKNSLDRTWPYALGISFGAGSTEDGVSVYEMGKKVIQIKDTETKEGLALPRIGPSYSAFRIIMSAGMALQMGTDPPVSLPAEETKGHKPKPIAFSGRNKENVVPSRLPLQIFKIGDFALLGIPGELTSMAGRRMREQVGDALSKLSVKLVALGTYANDYSQYITTKEEYDMQHYEGASTAFGPNTLDAYIQEYKNLVNPKDQFIDCFSSSRDARFYVIYEDANGKDVKLDTKKPVQSFRFHIPLDAKGAKVQAKWKSFSNPSGPRVGDSKSKSKWLNSKVVNIKLKGSGTAQSVEFTGRTIKYKEVIEMKHIHVFNNSSESILVRCQYKSKNGKTTTAVTGNKVNIFHEFALPWDAEDIRLLAEYGPLKNKTRENKTTPISVKLGSHDILKIEFISGILIYRGLVSYW